MRTVFKTLYILTAFLAHETHGVYLTVKLCFSQCDVAFSVIVLTVLVHEKIMQLIQYEVHERLCMMICAA